MAPSAHAVLHDLIRLRAGIGARGAAVAAGGGDHADSGTLFGRLGPRTTADGTCGGPSHCSAGNSFTLRRVRLILHSKALTLL